MKCYGSNIIGQYIFVMGMYMAEVHSYSINNMTPVDSVYGRDKLHLNANIKNVECIMR